MISNCYQYLNMICINTYVPTEVTLTSRFVDKSDGGSLIYMKKKIR
jgi:hypothetical protein